jgi:hypothetical protein
MPTACVHGCVHGIGTAWRAGRLRSGRAKWRLTIYLEIGEELDTED